MYGSEACMSQCESGKDASLNSLDVERECISDLLLVQFGYPHHPKLGPD